jgi:hypothetical protein
VLPFLSALQALQVINERSVDLPVIHPKGAGPEPHAFGRYLSI